MIILEQEKTILPNKTVLITGVRGMDGSILADKYLNMGWKVVGIDHWEPTSSYPNLVNAFKNNNFIFETGDICERSFMYSLLKKYLPDHFYNMAAISLVPESFKIPERVMMVNTMAVLNILELIKTHFPNTRLFQAGTSEQIGKNESFPQNTDSNMIPNSPYAIAKLSSYHFVRLYREAYGLFLVNGMTHNHEGPRRGPTFVTRKITRKVAEIYNTGNGMLEVGNIDTYRDWGYANDYCDAFMLTMFATESDDYSINTGEAHTVREFIEAAFEHVGIKIGWEGGGVTEVGKDETGKVLVKINPKYFRPAEVKYLHGEHSKITKKLGWKPTIKFKELVKIMMESDINAYTK